MQCTIDILYGVKLLRDDAAYVIKSTYVA
jgi:hypothetical protein